MKVKFEVGVNYYEPPEGVEMAGRRRGFEHRDDLIELSVEQQVGILQAANVLVLTLAPDVAWLPCSYERWNLSLLAETTATSSAEKNAMMTMSATLFWS